MNIPPTKALCITCPAILARILFAVSIVFICNDAAEAAAITFANVEARCVKDTSAVIQWESDVAATGQVEYGLTTSYGSVTEEKGLAYWQFMEITGLTAGTTYHFRIRAKDMDGSETISEDYTFTTRTPAEMEALVRAKRIDQGAADELPQEYYLKPDGDNDKDGKSIGNAWKDPSYAVRQLHAGDNLWVLCGTYYDNTTSELKTNNCGIETHRVTIKAYSGTPVWDGGGTYTSGFKIWHDGDPHQAGYVELNGIHIRLYGYAEMCLCRVTNVTVKNCTFSNSSVSLPTWCSLADIGSGVRNIIIDNCTFIDAGNFCLNMIGDRYGTSSKSSYLSVTNCYFEKTINHGAIQLCDFASHATFADNKFHDCYCGVGTYFHEIKTNPNRQSHIIIRDNIFTDITYYPASFNGTTNSLILNNQINGSGYSAFAIYGYCNNVAIKDNIITGSLRMYDDYNPGSPNTLVSYENNQYSDLDSTIVYYARCGGTLVIKDDLYIDANDEPRSYGICMRNVDIAGETIVEYTDGRVFDYSIITGTSYTLTELRWHPDKSDFSFGSAEDVELTIDVIPYNIFLQPTNEYLTVSAVSNTSVTVESTVATNPTTIGYSNSDYASSYVTLLVDGADYASEIANATGTVFHVYSGSWSSAHTFTWEKGETVTGAIAGTVTDKNTGSPIENATVTIEALGLNAQTASDGTYIISVVPIGSRTVTCIKTGYENASENNVVVTEDATTTVDFKLTQDATPPEITLKKITINGSVDDASVTDVEINGVSVSVTAGTYSHEVDVTSTNTITITATNGDGKTVTRTIEVK